MSDEQYEARGHQAEAPLSVSQLNWYIKNVLEQSVPKVWVEGEISDLSRPSSGHAYFTLKDENSQVRAVIWRSTLARMKFDLRDGLSVVCCGAIEVYPPRGSYQLIINRLQPQGIGPLQLAFQQMHAKLSKEGLFEPARKRELPRFPSRIAFVTSPSGAALHDFAEAARQRWPQFSLLVIPARVQGEQAAADIVRGIKLAQRLQPRPDTLIVGRGGGSIEDLWCFNEEPVVRAMAASDIPTVSAVGHEIDITLADLVADVRALTPTHAAELVLPSHEQVNRDLQQWQSRMDASLRTRISSLRQRLLSMAERSVLAHPHELHVQRRQRVDEIEMRARRAMQVALTRRRDQIESLARAVEALSPLQVLGRGYSLTLSEGSNQPLRTSADVHVGQTLRTILGSGNVLSQVVEVEEETKASDQ